MPRAAARARAGLLTHRLDVQLLRVAAEIECDERSVATQLEFLQNGAHQPVAPQRTLAYTVARSGDSYAIEEDGLALDLERDPRGVLEVTFRRAHEHALAALRPMTLLRAAVGSLDQSRFMLVGRPVCGLSTLAVRLLQAGAAMEGDALAVVRDGAITPFPRPFHLREGVEQVLPDLAGTLDCLPALEGQGLSRVWAWRPDRMGFDWRIRSGGVDAVVVVEANHGGDTRLVELPHYEAVRHVVAGATPWAEGGAWLAETTRIVDAATSYRLQLGHPDRAVIALEEALCYGRATG